ncbi:hypothetical protein BDR03DRAFT_707551 [Suillus americanus]|nr:hypothetical protein BDR03DRAFT_707551 [Suillus americanus]
MSQPESGYYLDPSKLQLRTRYTSRSSNVALMWTLSWSTRENGGAEEERDHSNNFILPSCYYQHSS